MLSARFLQLLLSGNCVCVCACVRACMRVLNRHLVNKFYKFNIANVVDIVSRHVLRVRIIAQLMVSVIFLNVMSY